METVRRSVFFKTCSGLILCLAVLYGLSSCSHKDHVALKLSTGRAEQLLSLTNDMTPVCYFDAIMKRNGLTDVSEAIPSVHIDMKYASNENFMHLNMYGCLRKAYVLPHVAEMLLVSQNALLELFPDYSLIVYDAARPLQIQQMMWDSLTLPVHEKIRFLSNPKRGSLHNFGAAVDVSIVDCTGKPIDMGTEYDYIGEPAHPVREQQMLEQGRITADQIANRQLLRKVMRQGGFWGIQTEWWHFNAMTRDHAIANYNLIR